MTQVGGAMVKPGNPKVTDVTRWEDFVTFPNLDDYDWAGCAERNKDYPSDGRYISMTIFTGLFERLISFMDMAEAMVALVDEDQQEGVHGLFDKLCVFYDDLFSRCAKWFKPDLFCFHDDWGSQRAPFFSLSTCREMLVPYLKRIVDSTHKYGAGFELHSCGKIEMLVPAMIEAGVDMWYGQLMNDKLMLCEKYGDQIAIGVDPDIPEDATVEEIRAAVESFMETYGKWRVFAGLLMMPPEVRDCLYELSRKAYCG